MKIHAFRTLGALAAIALLGACATAPVPYKNPIAVSPVKGRVAVSQAVTVLDASGSQTGTFPDAKATLEALVAAMPNGNYDAGQVHFGGFDRASTGLSSFNRGAEAAAAKGAEFLEGSTPLYSVLENEVAGSIGGGSGKAAVVVISDGLATDYAGRDDEGGRAVAAARALAESRSGATCFHTVQVGDSAAGAATLQAISNATNCGSATTAAALGSASGMQQFAQAVYTGGAPAPAPAPAPKPAAPVIGDQDADGVADNRDACPNTLRQARVDSRGCWTLSGLRFGVNAANIEPGYERTLNEDVDVLRANPGVRVRIDGHTDSDGSAKYNEGLSLRRAASVRDYFVKSGLDPERFTVRGFGEARPVAPNDSRDNKRLNRRVELTIVD